MTAQSKPLPKTIVKETTFGRLIKAPRELVFKAWTEQKHVMQWWGPRGFTNPVCDWHAKPGHKLYIEMRGPAGTPYDKPHPMGGMFHEVTQERLVFTSSAFEDAEGIPHLEVLNTVTFTEHKDGTKLLVHVAVTKATPDVTTDALKGMEEGWSQTLDRLENYIASMNRHHENGSRGLTVHALTKYADILDVCVCWLLTGQGNSSDKNNEHKSKSGNGHNGEDKIAFITAEFLSLNAKDKRDTLKVLVRFAHK